MRVLLPLALIGCRSFYDDAEDPSRMAQCDGDARTETLVVRDIRFVRQVAGVSRGFDLDGGGENAGCDVPEYTSPEGVEGIDNAFAALIPALELTEARTMEDIIAASVRSGELLILLQVDDLDDPRADACVDVTLQRGLGTPILGNDGEILPDQTFGVNPDIPESTVWDVGIVGGTVQGGPITVAIPIRIFEYDFDFALLDGQVRVDFRQDGTVRGLLAGGLPLDTLLQIAGNPDVDPDLLPLVEGLLGQFADLAPGPDGTCTRLSMTFEFEAVRAWVYDTP